MLGKTAGGLYWMFRYLERSENTARLLDAGFHIAQTRSSAADGEWVSVLTTSGADQLFGEHHGEAGASSVIDFLLRDPRNPSSVLSSIEAARENGRMVRTALTRELWEATNECWLTLKQVLGRPVRPRELPDTLATIRRQAANVCGSLYGTMLRNDIFDFAQLGTFVERADNTARILDVKYYVLLPTVWHVGSSLDNVQWEMILRSVSAQRSYRWLNGGEIRPTGIADFLILDRRMPRSLAYCYEQITGSLSSLSAEYGANIDSQIVADDVRDRLSDLSIENIFDLGLHEFLRRFIVDNSALAASIEKDFRFYE